MVIHPRSTTPPALQKAESPLYWSVLDPEADQQSHVPAPTTLQVSNSPHVPRFPAQTMLFSHHRSGRASSSRNSGSAIGIPGRPGMVSLILCYCRNSIAYILIVPHPKAVVAPVAAYGHQEPPLAEGVELESHSHSHHHQQQSPDHNHQSSNPPHLQSLISTPISTTLSLTFIVRSTVHYPEE